MTTLEAAAAAPAAAGCGEWDGGAAGATRAAGEAGSGAATSWRTATRPWKATAARAGKASARRARAVGAIAAAKAAIAAEAVTAAGLPATATSPRLAATARSARLLVDEEERPLVIVIAPLVEPDRLFLALADDAHHSAGDGRGSERAAAAGTRAEGATGAAAGGAPRPPTRSTRLTALPGAAADGLASLARDCACGRNDVEVLVRDRVLVLLPEIPPLDEHVDAGRQGLGAALEEANRADVLLPAPDELLFLLAAGVVPPHRHRDGHQDRHHRHRDEQRRHRIAAASALTP